MHFFKHLKAMTWLIIFSSLQNPIMAMEKRPLARNTEEFRNVSLSNTTFSVRSPRLPIFSSFLSVSSNNLLKYELLNEFLCVKVFQHLDIINTMIVPELRNTFNIKIIDSTNIQQANADKRIQKKLGSDVCNLEIIAGNLLNSPVPICPWHWVITKREDRFPFQRSMVKCNCQKCQAKTIFDSEKTQVSRCSPSYTLMPVLLRESVVDKNEIWGFYLEEVATSCVCNIRIQTF